MQRHGLRMNGTDDTPVLLYPRRARRKLETRERIVAAAQQLIRGRGYAETTLADIAAAADVHVTTLFTHFKSKRELSSALADAAIAQLETHVREAIGKLPFFEFIALLIKGWAREEQQGGSRNLQNGYELRSDPEMAFSWLQYQKREVALFAHYLATDYGLDPSSDLRPALVANMVSVGNVIAHERWLDTRGASDLEHDALTALEACKNLVGASLEAACQKS